MTLTKGDSTGLVDPFGQRPESASTNGMRDSTFADEAWRSLYELGVARIQSGASATLVEEVLLRAYACVPSRPEPLSQLAKFSLRQGRYDDAFRFAHQLMRKLPSDSRNDGVEARDVLLDFAESAWRTGRLKASLLAIERLLDNPTLDASERVRVNRTRTTVLNRLAAFVLGNTNGSEGALEGRSRVSVDGVKEATTSADATAASEVGVEPIAVKDPSTTPSSDSTEEPLLHMPLYCAHDASTHAMRYMVELHIACLESYFSHENTNDVLVTTNDERVLEVFSQMRQTSEYRFDLRFVSRNDLLSTFRTDETRLMDIPCMRMVFSKFFPILSGMSNAIVHVDFDTIFVSKVDLRRLLTSGIALVNANQFSRDSGHWFPSRAQASFFNIDQSKAPVCNWINSGVFAVQRNRFDVCRAAIEEYLHNLEGAIDAGFHDYPDELILNALAVRDPDAVAIIEDYRYNFLAYYLKHDPSWTWRGKIVHFHAVKPNVFRCMNGRVEQRYDTWHSQELDENFYLAALMWFRHLHTACHRLGMEMPMQRAVPEEVVDRELRRIVSKRSIEMVDICPGP